MQDESRCPELECLSLPVEAPLRACFDESTGVLTLESTVHRAATDRTLVRLRLTFSPEATHGFVSMLRAVESELGFALADPAGPPLRQ